MPIETVNIVAVISDTSQVITQAAHGFVVGDVLRCDDSVANTYVKALADTENNAKAVGVVSQIVNINSFVITYSGRLISGVPALAQGSVMYLSDSVAGAMTATAPAIAVRIMEISENAVSGIVNIDWKGGAGGGSVDSVTGDSVDNTDPANPVVNAWPLAGTQPGNLAAGEIEVDLSVNGRLISQDSGAGNVASLEFIPGGVGLRNVDSSGNAVVSANAGAEALIATIDGSANVADFRTLVNTFSDAATYPVINNINTKRIQFNGIAAPTITDDNTLGYKLDSFWIYNGVIYVCTDPSTGAAVWVASTGIPISLETDGTPNGDQSLLNLAAGTNMNLTDNGTGTVTFDAADQPAIVSLTRAALQALLAGSTADTTVIYRVTDAVGSTLVLDVFATANNALSGLALDQTNLRYLFYNITADTIIELYIPAIASVAQGDIAYYNGSAWTRLAAGTSINNLRTGGTGANPAWGLPIPCVDAGGTADAITATYSPAATLQDNLIVAVVAGSANTVTNPTFAPNGLTAHTIVKHGGQPLVAGDIPGAEAVALLRYDSANTRWELLNPAGNQGWIDWSASDNITGQSSIITNNFRYRPAGYKKIECVVNIRVVSNASPFTFDLPVAAANTHIQFIAGRILSNSVSQAGYAQTAANSVTMSVKIAAGGDPAATNNKEFSQNFFVETV